MPTKKWVRHLSYTLKCHFFITNTSKVSSDKMMQMYLHSFII